MDSNNQSMKSDRSLISLKVLKEAVNEEDTETSNNNNPNSRKDLSNSKISSQLHKIDLSNKKGSRNESPVTDV